MVADSLSRIPGSEFLNQDELLSNVCTLNVLHVPDLPTKLCADVAYDVASESARSGTI